MKKYRQLIKRIVDNPLGFAIVSSVFTMIVGLLVFRPFFEEGDDLGIAMIAEGAFGQNDYHLVYVNVILGKIVASLCSLIPSVRWYTLLQYMFIFVALFIVSLCLSHYRNGRFAAVILNASCLYEVLVSFQYTKIVSFIAVCGIMILLMHIKGVCYGKEEDSEKYTGILRVDFRTWEKRFMLIAAYVSIVFAILLRSSAFMIALVFAMMYGIVQAMITIRRLGLSKLAVYAAYFAPVAAILLISAAVESHVYNSDPEWNYFKSYNKARTSVVDYRYDALEYEKYADKLNELNLSSNDAYMMNTWQFADESVITEDIWNTVAKIPGKRAVDVDFIKAWIANIYNDLFVLSAINAAFAIVLAVFVIMSCRGSGGFFLVLLEGVMSLAVIFYYQYSGRWSHRVVYSALISLLIIFLMVFATEEMGFFKSEKSDLKKAYKATGLFMPIPVMIVLLLVIVSRIGNEFEYQDYLRRDSDFGVLQMYMEEEKDTLFVGDTFTCGEKYKYDVLTPMKQGALENYITTGSWSTAAPYEHEIVKRYGYINPFDALRRGSENVILIDNICPERKALFLTEHGDGPRYAADYLQNVCGYNLYRIK